MFSQNFNLNLTVQTTKKLKNVNNNNNNNNNSISKSNKKNVQLSSSPVISAVTPPPPQQIESFSTPFVTLKPLNFNTSSLASSAAIASVTVTTTAITTTSTSAVPPSPTVPKLLSPTPISNVGVIGELLVSNLVSSPFSSSNTTPSTSPLASPNKFFQDDSNNNTAGSSVYSRGGSNSTSVSPSSFLTSSTSPSSVVTRTSSFSSSSSDEDDKFNYSPTFSNLNSNFDDLSNLFTSSLCMLSNLPPLQQQPSQHSQQQQQQVQQYGQQVNNSQQQIILPPPSLPHQQCAIQENIRNVINYLGCCFRFGQISKNTLVEYLDLAFNDFGVSAEYFAKRSMEKDAIMPDQYCALVEINVENLLGELVNFSMKRHYYSFARKYSCLDARSYFDDYIDGTIIKLILDEIRSTNDYGTLLVDNEKFNEIYTDGIIYFNDSELLNSKGIIPSEAMPSSHITEHILCKKDSKNAINYFNYLIHGSVKLIIGKIEYTCIGSTHILPNRKLCGSLKNKFLNAFAIHQQTVNSADHTATDSLSNYYYQQQLQSQQISNSIGGSGSSNGNNGITSNPKEFSSKLYALKTVIMTAFYYHLYHYSSSNFVLHK